MKILKCAIVDDSETQQKLLERIINSNENLSLVHSFNSSVEGLKVINESKIDLLFLDIEMPFMNGFEFLSQLKIHPQVIIISKSQHYALEAFEFNVTDFLLKPISKQRFNIAVQKAIDKITLSSIKKTENKLVVKHNLKQVELNVNEILWIEALGDYVKIHKSYIINLKMIERYNHEFAEIMGKKIPISRTKNLQLDRLLNFLD